MAVGRKKQIKGAEPVSRAIQESLRMGYLFSEKCELVQSRQSFLDALAAARKAKDFRAMMEALSGLLRLAGEALDLREIERLDEDLDALMKSHPKHTPSMAWYCKGTIARHREKYKLAQRHFHRYLRAVRAEPEKNAGTQYLSKEEVIARGWTALAVVLMQRGHPRRAEWLAHKLLNLYGESGPKKVKNVLGTIHLLLGKIEENRRDFDTALRHYQKAHAAYMSEHNWYSHLHVLYGYARIARMQRNYPQCYWYLDLIDKAASGPEFGALRHEVGMERSRLEQDAVDLLIDSRKGVIRTREGGQVSLRKQYVLLHILEALTAAHSKAGTDAERGLSKAEIIETVWKERYRPEAHDNKLYYNINRLRKLIEPDVKQPQYLLNWKEGYRLAPGLRVHFVGNVGVKRRDG